MPSPTADLLREVFQTTESHLAALEKLNTTDGDGAPTRLECSAIQRVQRAIRQLATTLRA